MSSLANLINTAGNITQYPNQKFNEPFQGFFISKQSKIIVGIDNIITLDKFSINVTRSMSKLNIAVKKSNCEEFQMLFQMMIFEIDLIRKQTDDLRKELRHLMTGNKILVISPLIYSLPLVVSSSLDEFQDNEVGLEENYRIKTGKTSPKLHTKHINWRKPAKRSGFQTPVIISELEMVGESRNSNRFAMLSARTATRNKNTTAVPGKPPGIPGLTEEPEQLMFQTGSKFQNRILPKAAVILPIAGALTLLNVGTSTLSKPLTGLHDSVKIAPNNAKILPTSYHGAVIPIQAVVKEKVPNTRSHPARKPEDGKRLPFGIEKGVQVAPVLVPRPEDSAHEGGVKTFRFRSNKGEVGTELENQPGRSENKSSLEPEFRGPNSKSGLFNKEQVLEEPHEKSNNIPSHVSIPLAMGLLNNAAINRTSNNPVFKKFGSDLSARQLSGTPMATDKSVMIDDINSSERIKKAATSQLEIGDEDKLHNAQGVTGSEDLKFNGLEKPRPMPHKPHRSRFETLMKETTFNGDSVSIKKNGYLKQVSGRTSAVGLLSKAMTAYSINPKLPLLQQLYFGNNEYPTDTLGMTKVRTHEGANANNEVSVNSLQEGGSNGIDSEIEAATKSESPINQAFAELKLLNHLPQKYKMKKGPYFQKYQGTENENNIGPDYYISIKNAVETGPGEDRLPAIVHPISIPTNVLGLVSNAAVNALDTTKKLGRHRINIPVLVPPGMQINPTTLQSIVTSVNSTIISSRTFQFERNKNVSTGEERLAAVINDKALKPRKDHDLINVVSQLVDAVENVNFKLAKLESGEINSTGDKTRVLENNKLTGKFKKLIYKAWLEFFQKDMKKFGG